MLDPVEFGKAMASIVREATAPLLRRIEQLEARQPAGGGTLITVEGLSPDTLFGGSAVKVLAERLAEHQREKGEVSEKFEPGITDEQVYAQVEKYLKANPPPRGEKGEPGLPGKDANPVDAREVARVLLDSEDLESLVELRVKEEVAKIPPPKDGRDGEPGPRGEKGERGEQGPAGNDGAGIQDLLIDREGQLVATFTDGRTKSLGAVVGRDGNPGKDGADFTEVRFEYDGERTLKAIGKGGEIVYRLPIPIDRGYWRAGRYEQGDIATEGGTAYIAIKDTTEKPTLSSGDWRILARKGRDGKDGRNGIDKTASVKVNA